jgi:hypothetical protein
VSDLQRTALVMWGAMTMGVGLFAGVAAFLAAQHDWRPPPGSDQILLVFGALLLAVTAVAFFFPLRSLKGGQAEALALRRTIVGSALAEGACFMGLVGVLVVYDPRLLGATAVPFLLLLSRMPSDSRWQSIADGGEPPSVPS